MKVKLLQTNRMLRLLLCLAAVVAWGGTSLAQTGDLAKIDPELQELMHQSRDANERFRVIVELTAQYDNANLERSTALMTRARRRDYVVNELKRFSEGSQAEVVGFLSEQGTRGQVNVLHRFWIFNGVSCEASAACIDELSIRNDIGFIHLVRTIQLIDGSENNGIVSMNETVVRNEEGVGWHVEKIRANEVWNFNGSSGFTGNNVVVAIVDTGVNYNHIALDGKMWEGGDDFPNHGWDFGDGDNDPLDEYGHGSHVAGIVAGSVVYYSSGVLQLYYASGVAPSATIMALKISHFDEYGNLRSDDLAVINGFQFAIDHGADVINYSYGEGGGGRSYLREMMEYVLEIGVVVVAAAGNHGHEQDNSYYSIPYNIDSPGNCPPPWLHPAQDSVLQGGTSAVICVGATNKNDILAYYSSIGPASWTTGPYSGDYQDYPYQVGSEVNIGLIRPDIVAPGGENNSNGNAQYDEIKSIDFNDNYGYCYKQGTSMAAPCLTGVIALMLEASHNLTPVQIDSILETTAIPCENQTVKNNYYGAGRVDAYEAVATALNLVQEAVITTVAFPMEGGTIDGGGLYQVGDQCTLTATPNVGYVFAGWYSGTILISMSPTYTFTVSGDRSLTARFAPRNYTITVNASPAVGGTVSGGGTYPAGGAVTVSAHPNTGYRFDGWVENGAVVAHANNYMFAANADRTLTARFIEALGNIVFADANVKALCVANWDTNGDGELSYTEADAVTDLGTVFSENQQITSFEELQYFTGLTSIGDYAFENCSNLTGALLIPNHVTSIGESAFQGCSGFTGGLTIPNSVISIGRRAFEGCSSLSGSITIGTSLSSIDEYAFGSPDAIGFTRVIYTGSLAQWCGISFDIMWGNPLCQAHNLYINNRLVTNLTIPSTITEIKPSAFERATCLTSLTLPNSVTSIGRWAFSGCSGLTGNLTLPNSVTSIGNCAFFGCSGLTGSLTIPNSVTSIGLWAFEGCSGFTGSLTIGNSVTSIGAAAFGLCTGFSSMTVLPTTPPTLEEDAFQLVPTDIPVYVPCSSFSAYQAAEGWNAFSNFLGGDCPNYVIVAEANSAGSGTASGDGTFYDGQTCTLTATANSGYTFTYWTENGEVVSANPTYTFTVTRDRTLVANFVAPGVSAYVDLGLPSGTLWATWNVGAASPEGYGDYFAWGETQQKNAYDWSTYQYCYGHSNTLIKYCNNSQYGYNGYTDNLTMLLPGDDAATTNWGDNWRMPTYEEWMELLNNTTSTWTTLNGINGRLFTASNGASLFLPAAGYFSSSDLHSGNSGYYWSGSLDGTSYAKVLYANSGQMNSDSRFYGQSVRAVRASQTSTTTYIVTAKPNIVGGGALTNTQQGQRCTVTAISNTGYTFNNWTENGNVVSTNASYTFTVTGNRTLVANFRECSELSNLAVTNNSITSQSATVTWTGSDAGYIVQVMQYQATVFHESFENNGTTLPGGWTSVVGTGDGQWVVKTGDNSSSTGAHAGTYNVSCPHTSRNNTTYLISPAMDLSGTTSARLKFWMINRKWGSDIDECHVYYRVNGGDWNGPLFSTTEEHATWTEITVPLQGLATNYQIGFMSVDQWGYGLSLDDITVESCSWNTVYSSATSPYTFSGLTPNTTYSVRVLNICENASNVISFTTLDAHTLTTSVSPSASGSIACNPSAVNGVYDHGTQVRLTATANTGYTFKNWTENGAVVSTDASYTITMMGNRTLVANFVDNTANYTISASASLSNGGTVRGEGTYYGGTTCTLTASANDGYSFLNWTENGTVVSTESSYSFVVTGNRTLVANFVEGYLIGDGGDATNNYLPSYSYYKYSLTQQIYTADDIGTAGLITSIAFYNGGAEKTRTYDMYLVYTNKTIFDSDTDWVTVTEADKVFSDSMVMAANDWTVFVLDTPFAYNGTSNLAIIIDDNSGKFTSSPHMACRVFNANGNQAIRVYSDNTNYDPMSPPTSYGSGENVALHSVKNQIVFEILPPYHFVTSGNWGTASNWSNCTLPGANAEVFIDAPCQLNRNATVASLTVSSGQSLTLQSGKTLTVTNTLTNTATTGLVIEDGAQLMHASDNVSATVKKDIAGHGTGNGKFYLISNPLVSAVNPNLANVYFLTTGNYDLYSWLATAADHLEWRNFKDNAFTISPNGYGYLYANRSGVELNFPGILRPSHYRFAKSVSYNAGDAEHPGWNLIGNPFTCNAYLVNANNEPLPFYRMNAAGDGFEAVAPGTAVAPMEGIFYKTSGNGIVYFIRAD